MRVAQDRNDQLKMIFGRLDCRWREGRVDLTGITSWATSCRHLEDDCEWSSVVGDLGGGRQVRLRVCQLPSHPDNRTAPCGLSDDGGGSKGFGGHWAVEAPGDRDRAIAGVAHILPSPQEEVWRGAELVDLVLT
jgi:hypothetical protein